MTLVLDSHGVTSIAVNKRLLAGLRAHGQWPPYVPTVVLTECLTGDHRRDHLVNSLLKTCQLREVGEALARSAASLRRHRTGKAGVISAVDAIVVSLADQFGDAVILTSDPAHLRTLVSANELSIRVEPVP